MQHNSTIIFCPMKMYYKPKCVGTIACIMRLVVKRLTHVTHINASRSTNTIFIKFVCSQYKSN